MQIRVFHIFIIICFLSIVLLIFSVSRNKESPISTISFQYPKFHITFPKFSTYDDFLWFLDYPLSRELFSRNEICRSQRSEYCLSFEWRDVITLSKSLNSIPEKQQEKFNTLHNKLKVSVGEQPVVNKNVVFLYDSDEYTTGDIQICKNGIIERNIPCDRSSTVKFYQMVNPFSVKFYKGVIIYLNIQGAESFHQFYEEVVPKISQLSLLRHPDIGNPLTNTNVKFYLNINTTEYWIVPALLEKIGITRDRIIQPKHLSQSTVYIQSDIMVYVCRTPTLHPFLWQNFESLLLYSKVLPNYSFSKSTQTYHINAEGTLPLPSSPARLKYNEEKKLIIYLQRNTGTISKGRKVVNEEAVLDSLNDIAIKIRKYRFDVEVLQFDHDNYLSLDQIMETFSNAIMIVGPNGGAFTNIMFAPKNCKIVEFFPVDRNTGGDPHFIPPFRYDFMYYKYSRFLGLDYYTMKSDANISGDMVVPLKSFQTLLSSFLSDL